MAMGRCALSCVTVVCMLIGTATAAPSDRKNVLNFSEGALALSATSRFDAKWDPLYLIDGNNQTGWRSAEGKTKKNEIVIELALSSRIEEVVLDSTGGQEKDFPGCSAKTFELWTSRKSAQKGFSRVLTAKAAQSARNVYQLPRSNTCRWVKLVIKDNWGNASFTQLMEFGAYGRPLGKKPKLSPLDGVYGTNLGAFRIKQRQSSLMGCYDGKAGRVHGKVRNQFLYLQWEEPDARSGTAILVPSADRGILGGFRYEDGKPAGAWMGKLSNTAQPKCKLPANGRESLRESLEKTGYAVLFGVSFTKGTADMSDKSDATLQDLFEVISRRQEAGFLIEGHTDDTGDATQNTALSLQRAQAVMGWLVSHGMEPERLSAEGYGDTRPAADNGMAEGKILNQRVEIHMTK